MSAATTILLDWENGELAKTSMQAKPSMFLSELTQLPCISIAFIVESFEAVRIIGSLPLDED